MCKGAGAGWIRSCTMVSDRTRALPATGRNPPLVFPAVPAAVMVAVSELSGCGGGSVPVSATALPLDDHDDALPAARSALPIRLPGSPLAGPRPYSWALRADRSLPD